MYIENSWKDLKIINYYVGLIVVCISSLMIIPVITSICFKEWTAVIDFLLSLAISLITGSLLLLSGKNTRKEVKIQWKHGLIIASFSWILLMVLCAIPYRLSGNSLSFLDSCFDVMSGFTTTGIVLTQDLDHLSLGLNMWRHILTFVGGQGMVVLALSLLVKNTAGAYKMYVGEGKDIGLLPNFKNTAKIIWIISMIYFAVGVAAFWINGLFIGLKPVSSLMNAIFIFCSAWSTGGFAPYSQNILYYHSFSYEVVSIIFFIIGSFNFGLHYAIWKNNKKEIFKNIETQSFAITATICCLLLIGYFSKTNLYPNFIAVFRKVIYQLLSAHTTTGFGSLYTRQLAVDWGDFPLLIMTIAMLIGGSACSTAGGFKGLRVGVVFKGIVNEIRGLISSENRVSVKKIHYMKDIVLDSNLFKTSMLIIICYIALFTFATALGTYYGYPVIQSAFEAASATGNVGLSIGVATVTTPAPLKLCYIITMYLGRLEFISVFALIGFLFGGIKKLWKKSLNR